MYEVVVDVLTYRWRTHPTKCSYSSTGFLMYFFLKEAFLNSN